jgi:hypothetical protein
MNKKDPINYIFCSFFGLKNSMIASHSIFSFLYNRNYCKKYFTAIFNYFGTLYAAKELKLIKRALEIRQGNKIQSKKVRE